MKNKKCFNCGNIIKDLEVVEITTNRVIAKYSEGKLDIGDRVIVKHIKKFKCCFCHVLLTNSQKTAERWINGKK